MDGYDIDLMAIQGNSENYHETLDETEAQWWNDLIEFHGLN